MGPQKERRRPLKGAAAREESNMIQATHRCDNKIKEQRSREISREMTKIENAYYDGEAAEAEYSKVICDLLKDPVSLGIVGGNSNRGHQL